jgi:hypothetical protein
MSLMHCTDDEIVDTSPVPTHECNVQANCLKCRTHIFYKGASALVACHSCKLLHSCVECPHCGTFFPASTDDDQLGKSHIAILGAFCVRSLCANFQALHAGITGHGVEIMHGAK